MGGTYGTTIWAFGDQLDMLKAFSAKPKVTGGYEYRTNERDVLGVIRLYSAPPTAEGIKAKVPSFQGEGHGNIVIQKWPFFVSDTEQPVGDFIEDVDGTVYRVVATNRFTKEVGVVVQGLEKVVGLNGTHTDDLAFNIGRNTFD